MERIFVGYSTIEGQTEKIAKTMADDLRKAGHEVDLINMEVAPPYLNPSRYDRIILGASVHMTQYPLYFRNWVRENAPSLRQLKGSFFSVCLGILEDNPATKTAEREIVTKFFDDTGWYPAQWTIFAGALKYSKYGWIKKKLLKAISSRAGVETSTDRDYEYTDWKAVNEFAMKVSTP